ncbi:MAG: SIS domain-containing protein [Pseudomonadales bacterium]
MEQDHYIIELFHNNIDITMQALDSLAPRISDCGTLLVQRLLKENKILCCGEGQSGALAQIFASNLLNRFDYERPSLPAIALSADATTITAVTGDGTFNEVFATQIRALGQPGDLLFVISNGSGSGTTLQAIQAAHDREMIVISISNQDNSDITALILPEDREICIPSTNRARVVEVQLLTINCLCDLIDQQLFGSH